MISFQKILIFIIGILITAIIFWSCDEFQSKDFKISDSEDSVCELLSADSLTVIDTTFVVINDTLVLDSLLFDTSKVLDSSKVKIIKMILFKNYDKTWDQDSVILANIPAVMDTLEANDKSVTVNTSQCYEIYTKATVDTNYVFFSTDENSVVCYIDTFYINMNILDSEGNVLAPDDEAISPESVYYCPDMQLRHVYNLQDNRYLIQFIEIAKQETVPFRLAIFPNR